MNNVELLLGDSRDILKELEDNSVDSIVTDPPYEIGFMGKAWDNSGIAYDTEFWKECMRVLKPGGHLLAFSHSRTYHRMAVAVEDAGFEIRDQILWVYGSGFPKSHNIGKAVDKIQGNSPYEGWGTALKPAHEPIVMGRKPFKGTVAENMIEWGTGGINIDECRIGTEDDLSRKPTPAKGWKNSSKLNGSMNDDWKMGRFPANIIFDEEAGKILDEHSGASRFFYCPKASKRDRNEGCDALEEKSLGHTPGDKCGKCGKVLLGPSACKCETPQRVFQSAKNNHPTVKPTDLLVYLVRLVTPKGGIVLDPFMGSGSTGKACMREGMNYIGIEMNKEYYEIAKARISYESDKNILNKFI